MKSASAVVAIVFASALSACSWGKDEDKAAWKNCPTHTVVFGGDLGLGRRSNAALFDKRKQSTLLGDVAGLLEKADLAIVNGEGVISGGGEFTDKGEAMPYMYRAHPRAMGVLAGAGIDVMTVGNNHVGDYGKDAFREMLDRLSAAGMDYAGGGYDLSDASRPAYRVLGDTVIAVVGANLTHAPDFPAGPDSPGTFFHADAETGGNEEQLVTRLTRILTEARKHAHVVLFSPHWGRNQAKKPTVALRRLARKLIKAGYDAIIGHSSHMFHGVELIDGKPVIYDAGNMVLDYGGSDDAHQSMLWELVVNRAGVARITGFPLWLQKNHSTLAKGKVRDGILDTLKKRSKALDAELKIQGGAAVAECDPGGVEGPKTTPAFSEIKRPVLQNIRLAHSDAMLDALPEAVQRVNVEYDEGIRLIGYKLITGEITVPSGCQIVALYWTAAQKVEASYDIHLEARGLDKKTGMPATVYANHLPGDWLWPTTEWPAGKVIQDWTLFRLKLKPQGRVDFYAGFRKETLLQPRSYDTPLVEGKLLHLGYAVYAETAKSVFDAMHRFTSGLIR